VIDICTWILCRYRVYCWLGAISRTSWDRIRPGLETIQLTYSLGRVISDQFCIRQLTMAASRQCRLTLSLEGPSKDICFLIFSEIATDPFLDGLQFHASAGSHQHHDTVFKPTGASDGGVVADIMI
jgi:hypothetical protein